MLYVLGPVLVAALFGVVIVIAHWALGSQPGLLESRPPYGLLVPVARGVRSDHLSPLQEVLLRAGIRSTIAGVAGDYRLLVWRADVAPAEPSSGRSGTGADPSARHRLHMRTPITMAAT